VPAPALDAGTGPTSLAFRRFRSGAWGLDQVFELLKNERRRYVLRYMRGREEVVHYLRERRSGG